MPQAARGIALRLDANGAWSVEEAVRAIDSLAPAGLELVEEPVHGLHAVREVRERVAVRVAIDETAAEHGALGAGVADAVCLKISRCGGISSLIAAATLVRASGAEVYLASTLDGPLGIAAALHAAAALASRGPVPPCGLATLRLFDGLEDPLPARDGQIAAADRRRPRGRAAGGRSRVSRPALLGGRAFSERRRQGGRALKRQDVSTGRGEQPSVAQRRQQPLSERPELLVALADDHEHRHLQSAQPVPQRLHLARAQAAQSRRKGVRAVAAVLGDGESAHGRRVPGEQRLGAPALDEAARRESFRVRSASRRSAVAPLRPARRGR